MAKTLVIKDVNFALNALDRVTFEETIPCTGITLDKSTSTITGLGNTVAIIATVTPADTTDVISWASSSTAVATVINGVVTAVGLGAATITATCGNYSASCSVAVEAVPNYAVIGAINPFRTASAYVNGALINPVGNNPSVGYKYGVIALATDDTNVKTVDRVGDVVGDYRLCPIALPNGASRIKIESKLYNGSTLQTFKTRFLWFDSTQIAGSGYVGAKCLDGLTSDSAWDQTDLAPSVAVDIPSISGINSFAVALFMSDWDLFYNTDYANDFDVTIL